MQPALRPFLAVLLLLAPALAACGGGGGGDGTTNPPAVAGIYLNDMAGVDCG